MWISEWILWITFVKIAVFGEKKPNSCGKTLEKVGKPVDK
jgi:hypothetical protein